MHSNFHTDAVAPAVLENIFESTAAFFSERGLSQHYAELCEFSAQQRDPIEARIRSRHPQLPVAGVDLAAYAVLKRIWKLAPGLAAACSEPAQFKARLAGLLKPCIHFCALDELRKFERQQALLNAHVLDPEVMQESSTADISEGELSVRMSELRRELAGSGGALANAVLEIILDHALSAQNGGRRQPGVPGNESVREALRKRRICASLPEVSRARKRIARVARRIRTSN